MKKDPADRSVFSKRLRQCRMSQGLTQRQIAEALGIDRSTYAYYEVDKTNPDFEVFCRIARLYGVTADYLLGLPPVDMAARARMREKEGVCPYGVDEAGMMKMAELSEEEQKIVLAFRQIAVNKQEDAAQQIVGAIQELAK